MKDENVHYLIKAVNTPFVVVVVQDDCGFLSSLVPTAASLCSVLIRMTCTRVCVSLKANIDECLFSSGLHQCRGKVRIALSHCPHHGELTLQQLLTKRI